MNAVVAPVMLMANNKFEDPMVLLLYYSMLGQRELFELGDVHGGEALIL